MKSNNPSNPQNSGGYSQAQVDALLAAKPDIVIKDFTTDSLASGTEAEFQFSFTPTRTITADEVYLSGTITNTDEYVLDGAWTYTHWYVSSIEIGSDGTFTAKIIIRNGSSAAMKNLAIRFCAVY